jgi:hypothetical protein
LENEIYFSSPCFLFFLFSLYFVSRLVRFDFDVCYLFQTEDSQITKMAKQDLYKRPQLALGTKIDYPQPLWYFNDLSREQAQDLLSQFAPHNCFLIRISSIAGKTLFLFLFERTNK